MALPMLKCKVAVIIATGRSKHVNISGHVNSQKSRICMFSPFTLETPFDTFAKREDPDQAALIRAASRSGSSYKSCLIRVYSVCLYKYD